MNEQRRIDRFTPRAREAMKQAQQEARTLAHRYVGTEHLLLALSRNEENAAMHLLKGFDADAVRIRQEVTRILQHGGKPGIGKLFSLLFGNKSRPDDDLAVLPLTGRVRNSLELAAQETYRQGSHTIDTDHLLFGLAREGQGIAAQALRALSIDSEALHAHM